MADAYLFTVLTRSPFRGIELERWPALKAYFDRIGGRQSARRSRQSAPDTLGEMATQKDVQRIALSLPGTSEVKGRFAFSVARRDKQKAFVWVWRERVKPKKPRVPNPAVLAVRVADLDEKNVLLGLDGEKFFTEPHYDGFPAVLVRLSKVTAAELRQLVTSAWRCMAPRSALSESKPMSAYGRSRARPRRR